MASGIALLGQPCSEKKIQSLMRKVWTGMKVRSGCIAVSIVPHAVMCSSIARYTRRRIVRHTGGIWRSLLYALTVPILALLTVTTVPHCCCGKPGCAWTGTAILLKCAQHGGRRGGSSWLVVHASDACLLCAIEQNSSTSYHESVKAS